MTRSTIRISLLGLALLGCVGQMACSARVSRAPLPPNNANAIAPYHPRAGREVPVIAVIGSNRGTELSDFLVPYGILARDPALEVQAVSVEEGVLATFTDLGEPGPRLRLETTISAFDKHFPAGADYVVVPAQASSPALLSWLKKQVALGATLVSVCNGALAVADTGLFAGRSATAHWSTEGERNTRFPTIHWTRDKRYMADGPWVSTTGVSAAVPATLALVEAIHGRAQASPLAANLGVAHWSPAHDTGAFSPKLPGNAWPLAKVIYINRWVHRRDAVRVPVSDGVDEISLALTIDAYSSTGRSRAYVAIDGNDTVRTLHGLTLLRDDPIIGSAYMTVVLPVEHPATALDQALDGIMRRYGRATANGVALVFEYPRHKQP